MHWLDTHVAPLCRWLAEAVFPWSWATAGCDESKSTPQLSLFSLTCFKNNYSVRMHADISILQLVLQLSAKFSRPFLMILLCAHIFSKCKMVIVQLFQLGIEKAQSEQWSHWIKCVHGREGRPEWTERKTKMKGN